MQELKSYIEERAVKVPKGCWLWSLRRDRHGYGCANYKGKTVGAHRLSYMAHNGEIPKGMLVRHTCDIRECVNPEHLQIGTHSDNMRDIRERSGRKFAAETLDWLQHNRH